MLLIDKISCVFIILLLRYGTITNSAKILAIFPTPSYSHQVVFRELTVELSKRGHELVVYTTDPLNDPKLRNYTEFSLKYLYKPFHNHMKSINLKETSIIPLMFGIAKLATILADEVFKDTRIQSLISVNNTEKFDLLIAECFLLEAIYAISVPLNVPIVGLTSLPLLAMQSNRFGNPIFPAYVPDVFGHYTDDMNIWQRTYNFISTRIHILGYHFVTIPEQEAVIRKHFNGTMTLSLDEISKKIAMVFVSSHLYFSYPRPNIPSILIRGFRTGNRMKNRNNRTLPYLPPDVKQILDNSKKGFIYFSLGTNFISSDVLGSLKSRLLETFSELPYNVIWSYGDDTLPGKPDNVYVRKWWPQEAILAHPNIVLFIYQGGLQSTEEAIDLGVPLIGIPLAYDQKHNIARLRSLDLAKTINFDTSKEELKSTILEIAQNSSYKERMLKYRDLLYDVPLNPLDEVVWWTEHVIRHKGAAHLYNKSRDLPWYTVELFDIMLLLLCTLLAIIFALYKMASWGIHFLTWLVKRKSELRVKND